MKRFLTLVTTFCLFLALSSYNYLIKLPPPKESVNTIITLLDRYGEQYMEISYPSRRPFVSLNDISPYIIQGFLAAEDHSFYQHSGFDLPRIARSALNNFKEGRFHSGASTITQQYSRNLFNNFEKTWSRKLKEAIYTIRLESSYEKNEILEGYLNLINFGHGTYGIAEAANFYFNKHPNQLTLGEGSLLVGIPQSPANFSPLYHLEQTLNRQQQVLLAMENEGFITSEERMEAQREAVKLSAGQKNDNLYYVDGVFSELSQILTANKYKQLTIHTTYDPEIQAHVNTSVQEYLKDGDLQVAVIAMEPLTGDILALRGGQNYEHSSYNRALWSRRQVGSLIKPILYYAALEYGFNPSTTFACRPTSFLYLNGQALYEPHNYNEKYPTEPVSLANALAISDNIYAVKTHTFLGMDVLSETAKRLGLQEIPALPAAALGTSSIGIREITEVYSIFANQGKSIKSRFILQIKTPTKTLYKASHKKQKQILDPEKTYILNEMMTGMFNPSHHNHLRATGAHLAPTLSHRYGGKSGTTSTDSWMIGYTPELLTTVWIGYDEGRLLCCDSLSQYIWAYIMENSLQNSTWYPPTENAISLTVDAYTGTIVPPDSKNAIPVYFEKKNLPLSGADIK